MGRRKKGRSTWQPNPLPTPAAMASLMSNLIQTFPHQPMPMPTYHHPGMPQPFAQQQVTESHYPPTNEELIQRTSTIELPLPPKWSSNWASLQASALAQVNPSHDTNKPYIRAPVSAASLEYQVILDWFAESNIDVKSIDRIYNPTLLRKFNTTRRDMLLQKSEDLGLLKELGMSKSDIAERRTHIKNRSNPNLPMFSENIALLVHGSRASLDDIFSQGLDARMSNAGLLGAGIYFADNPGKSVPYDSNTTLLLFAVLLGDSLVVPPHNARRREPQKSMGAMRNPHDMFFDSICG
ncbi:hypothetical protein HDU76_006747, partial [Blyttiomyces sp. JEL0837]